MTAPHYAFHFHVNWDGTYFLCSEINGLNAKIQVTEYREDLSHEIDKVKIPGLIECGNIMLKHCMFPNDMPMFFILSSRIFLIQRGLQVGITVFAI